MRHVLCALLVACLFGAVSPAAAQDAKSVVGTTEGPYTDKLAACNSAKASARKQARDMCEQSGAGPRDYQYGQCDCEMPQGKRVCKVEVKFTCGQ